VTAEPAAPRVLVSLATYNERETLPPLLREVRATVPDAHVLVVDDNSPDGTGRMVEGMAEGDPHLHVLHRAGKLGLGTAIVAGMRYAQEHGYDYFVNLDADFSHPPRYLPALLAGMKTKDVMIGSRYVPGGGTKDWPWQREFISRGVNLLVRVLMRLPARDCSGSYRCYRVAKLKDARLEKLISRGYSFQQEVLYRCHKAGCKIGETPIVFEERRAGSSKVNPREAVRSMSLLVWIGLHAFFGVDV
jgi:dolichol-phosphate mannosyltransferase